MNTFDREVQIDEVLVYHGCTCEPYRECEQCEYISLLELEQANLELQEVENGEGSIYS